MEIFSGPVSFFIEYLCLCLRVCVLCKCKCVCVGVSVCMCDTFNPLNLFYVKHNVVNRLTNQFVLLRKYSLLLLAFLFRTVRPVLCTYTYNLPIFAQFFCQIFA